MNKFALLGIAGIAGMSAIVAAPAEAGTFTTYSNRADWTAALEGLTTDPIETETFDGLALEQGLGLSFDTGKLTASSDSLTTITDLEDPYGNAFTATALDTTFALQEPSLGFGVDLRQQSDIGDATLIWKAFDEFGGELDTGTVDVASSFDFTFFGLISDDPTHLISSIQFNYAPDTNTALISYNDAAFVHDDETVESVPEPFTLMGLGAIGLVGAGSALKRKQAADA